MGTLVGPALAAQHLSTSLQCSHIKEALVTPAVASHLLLSCSSHCPGLFFCTVLVLPDPREVPFLFQYPFYMELVSAPPLLCPFSALFIYFQDHTGLHCPSAQTAAAPGLSPQLPFLLCAHSVSPALLGQISSLCLTFSVSLDHR